ncbi:hypothetical protein [Streptomyces sp. NPDC056061]|uniref:hypothetical protein n=1 Tax=Streptomyces sp. NPDC056061 TaxID=3345700 RepID=UPI0035D8EAB4
MTGGKRVQRVRVPMRLVWSPFYQDVALSTYVKIKALASRPEGCQARTETIASYLGLSASSVERGMTQLRRPGPDGVVELRSERRTLPGGTGRSAIRAVRPMSRDEAFVWLPVAVAEDLTPRQLRVYALVAYAQARRIAVTESELASHLRHYSGRRAGQALTVTAASAVVDEVETARWVTVRRRAGERGRNLYIAHDIAPEARPDIPADGCGTAPEAAEAAVGSGSVGASSSQAGEGSGSQAGEGSVAYKESPRTDSPDDGRALLSPAVGDVQVVEGVAPVENPADGEAAAAVGWAGLALRAGGKSKPASDPMTEKRSSRSGSGRGSSSGGLMVMSAEVYTLLEPVHHLLAQVTNPFVARKIAREVTRQLADGTARDRLSHRLTARCAVATEIRDPGRWLLGVALPRWGCGLQDCEAGVIWRTGVACEICAETVQDKAAARQRTDRAARGLCPEHGTRPGPAGHCTDCELDAAIDRPAPAPREPEGPPRGACGDCGARIMLTGHALTDGLCKPCRTEPAQAPGLPPTAASTAAGQSVCTGKDGTVPCTRKALPTRTVCLRHRAQDLAGAVA